MADREMHTFNFNAHSRLCTETVKTLPRRIQGCIILLHCTYALPHQGGKGAPTCCPVGAGRKQRSRSVASLHGGNRGRTSKIGVSRVSEASRHSRVSIPLPSNTIPSISLSLSLSRKREVLTASCCVTTPPRPFMCVR